MNHTKGEWKYNVSKKNEIQTILPNGKVLHLGFIYSDDCRLPTCCRKEEHANAKLISAAPDLLEALIDMVKMYEEIEPAGGYQGYYDMAKIAITKATIQNDI